MNLVQVESIQTHVERVEFNCSVHVRAGSTRRWWILGEAIGEAYGGVVIGGIASLEHPTLLLRPTKKHPSIKFLGANANLKISSLVCTYPVMIPLLILLCIGPSCLLRYPLNEDWSCVPCGMTLGWRWDISPALDSNGSGGGMLSPIKLFSRIILVMALEYWKDW